MNTTDVQRYSDNYEVLSTDAALWAEQIACRLRHLIYSTTSIKKEEYLTSGDGYMGWPAADGGCHLPQKNCKKLLLASQPDWFIPYLSGGTETNRLKSDVPRRHRMILISLNPLTTVPARSKKSAPKEPGFAVPAQSAFC